MTDEDAPRDAATDGASGPDRDDADDATGADRDGADGAARTDRDSGDASLDRSALPEGVSVPALNAGRSREEATALRDAIPAEERERVEATVADLLDLLGKTHAMAVLSAFAFADGPLRFSDLESELDVAPNTLSARLKELTAASLLDREAFDEIPPRVEYRPTPKAEALFPVFGHLHHWGLQYTI